MLFLPGQNGKLSIQLLCLRRKAIRMNHIILQLTHNRCTFVRFQIFLQIVLHELYIIGTFIKIDEFFGAHSFQRIHSSAQLHHGFHKAAHFFPFCLDLLHHFLLSFIHFLTQCACNIQHRKTAPLCLFRLTVSHAFLKGIDCIP